MNINLLNDNELALFRQFIDNAKNIVLCCHQNPDGDAIGSCLGMAEYLRQHDKNTMVVVPDKFPDFLQWLPDSHLILRYDKHPERVEEVFAHTDLVFCLDFNRPERMESLGDVMLASPAPKIMIDHHPEPTIPTVLSISHPELSSSSELVFRIIWQLGGFESMTRRGAIPSYCGMMTDTGGFTYNSNNPEIYFIISQLLTKHIDNPLAKITRTQIKHLYPIAMQREMNLRINQYYTLKCLKYIVQFSRVRFQEFSSCRYIKKKILDREVTADRTRNR